MGLDLVEIARIKRMLASKGNRALRRLFTEGEAAYALARSEPYRHLAARIAAKEATYKALAGTARARGIGWREIEVVSEWDGRPSLVLHGSGLERAEELGVARMWLALTHSEATAAAVTILERDEWAARGIAPK